ncbi:U4/U6-U5 snRNP complex subunit prp31 [Lithohypha guttulata]|nr:U4/U6-U5 snRNP complex subunit prp31 [Lithohypha guttulata]
MATLADELLNDFEDSGDENNDVENGFGENEQDGDSSTAQKEPYGLEVDANEDAMSEDGAADADEIARIKAEAAEDEDEDSEDELVQKSRVEKMQLSGPVLDQISYYQNLPPEKRLANIGSIEDDPEYKLLTESNSLSTQIDGEIVLVHKFIRDHYSKRFPELETLISNPLDYARTVAIIKNGPLKNIKSLATSRENIVGTPLQAILDGPTLMVVSVEGTQTKGQEMSEPELQTVLRACRLMLDLDKAKTTLTDYVQSRMNNFAPNLTALIGSLTAAQLLNFAGGLKGLAKTPDRNIPAMGSKKQRQTGLATNVGLRKQGFLYYSPLMQDIASDLKVQAMRIIGAKIVLAARVDSVHQSRDGSMGEKLYDDCERRLDKLREPPPNRGTKALPVPDDKPSRKRGGRRARKAKEATAMTDLRKQQNRMAFGREEKEVGFGEDSVGLGMIGQGNDGRIRAAGIDKRTAARLSKKNPGWGGSGLQSSLNTGMASSLKGFGSGVGAGNATTLRAQGLRTSGVNAASGTASSLTFGAAQGIELVDPKVQAELKRKREAENAGYFSGGTFSQINTGGKTDAAGFKVPTLPPVKKVNTGMGPPSVPKG